MLMNDEKLYELLSLLCTFLTLADSCSSCMLMRLKENVCESGNENNDELNLHKANTTHF